MVVNGRLHDQITAGWYKKQAVIQQTGGKQGVKHSLMTDASGLPLSVVVAGANTHDIKLVADTLDALQTGKTGKNLRLCMDKGYEAEWLELYLKTRAMSLISNRGKKNLRRSKTAILRLIFGLWKERIAG